MEAPPEESTGTHPKVLLICYSYPPVIGGSEVEAQRVAEELIRRGYQVEVLCGAEDPMPQQPHWVDPHGVPVRILGIGWPPGAWMQRAYSFQVGWYLFKHRNEYQIVYSLMQGLHLAVSLLISRFLKKPLVMKISGSAIIPALQTSWLGRLELKWLQRWAEKVMILNQGMEEEAAAAGFDLQQLLWMPNPVDIDQFCPAEEPERSQLRQQHNLNGPTVLYVGRLAPEKELSTLVGGFARAAEHHPDAQLVFLGDGPCRKELEDRAQALGIAEHVRFAGRASSDEVCQWLQAADVFALVSRIEGFSCSLTEAMAAGLPSVVSDIPGNRQLIDEEVHGLRSVLRDEASIGACLDRLLGDPALRSKLGAASRNLIVENFSTKQVVDRYEVLFQQVLQGNGYQSSKQLPGRTGTYRA